MYTEKELAKIVASFKGGELYYQVEDLWPTLSYHGRQFKKKWEARVDVPVDYNVVFEDLHVMLGFKRFPTVKEVQNKAFEEIKKTDIDKEMGFTWYKEEEKVFKDRVARWYRSHILEEYCVSRLQQLYPDCKVWGNVLIDMSFGVDIVFEDKKTGLNYYFHITMAGNKIQYKDNKNKKKDKSKRPGKVKFGGKEHWFTRDFSFSKGHHTLYYAREKEWKEVEQKCKRNQSVTKEEMDRNQGTVYFGSQAFLQDKYLRDQVEFMRTLSSLHDFDKTESPAELTRFYKFLGKIGYPGYETYKEETKQESNNE